MKRITAVFLAIVLLTLGSFAVLWAISPEEERENVMATQGIRLVGSTVVNMQGGSGAPTRIKVGDLLMGSDERIYRVNELRKGQSDSIYVVVSWKKINDYTTYEQYLSEPYSRHATYELRAFAYNKSLTTEADIRKFYTDYSTKLAAQISEQRAQANIDRAMAAQESPNSSVEPSEMMAAAEPAPVVVMSSPRPPPPPPPSEAAIPRSKPNTVSIETTAYAVAELNRPDDVSKEDLEAIERATAAIE